MIACTVSITMANVPSAVSGATGRTTYTGLFASTCAAVCDALARFPHATRVSAKAVAA